MAHLTKLLPCLVLVAACGGEGERKTAGMTLRVEGRLAKDEPIFEGDEILPEPGASATLIFNDGRETTIKARFVVPSSGDGDDETLLIFREMVAEYDRKGPLRVAARMARRGPSTPETILPAGRIQAKQIRFRWLVRRKNPVVMIRITAGGKEVVALEIRGETLELHLPPGHYSYTIELVTADGVEKTDDTEDRTSLPVEFEVVAGERDPGQATSWIQHLVRGKRYLDGNLAGNALEEFEAALLLRPKEPAVERWRNQALVAAGMAVEKKG